MAPEQRKKPPGATTFVFVVDVAKMNDVEFHQMFDKITSFHRGAGLQRFNIFDQSVFEVFRQLDPLIKDD